MFKRIMPLLFLLPITIGLAPAEAQGIKVNKNALEKVDWYHAPKEYQIINGGPGGVQTRAGFGSNIPSAGVPRQAPLPAANSTNLMAGQYKKPAPPAPPTAPGSLLKAVRSPQRAITPAAPIGTATYGNNYSSPASSFSGSSAKTSTSVTGTLKRGQLLGH
jgi:hypothetical protein